MSKPPVAVIMTTAILNLIGGTLFLPAFRLIQPLPALCLSITTDIDHPHKTLCSDPTIVTTIRKIPHFKDGTFGSQNELVYGSWMLVIAIGILLIASAIDFASVLMGRGGQSSLLEEAMEQPPAGSFAAASQSFAEAGAAAGGTNLSMKRMIGPTVQMCANCIIFSGSIMLLPNFTQGGPNGSPLPFLGSTFPGVGTILFQVAAIVFFFSAVTAILGTTMGIIACRKAGRPTGALWACMAAFGCFCGTSFFFFSNSFLDDDVQAGHWRMAAGSLMATAFYILFGVTMYSVCMAKASVLLLK